MIYTIVITSEIIAAILLVAVVLGYVVLCEMDRAENAS